MIGRIEKKSNTRMSLLRCDVKKKTNKRKPQDYKIALKIIYTWIDAYIRGLDHGPSFKILGDIHNMTAKYLGLKRVEE